ncbi:Oidioi.mRNA.OKI2018_I69.PAR.g9449.t1.cds [Oikopleura dioica]|uniref:Oidioi.mRNA.OKI2018_I69.PAR.g9449.t1.cds n=1 Tax=Oikopleura dioica TaxID=34765 RepID=A0ABN7RPR0_OIKDI|nr:Oidioi.mRNA.OKI2018_I69.PAR.g9449.t1.cds [Oikopleura dioica]
MRKDAAYEFCGSMNKSLPKERLTVVHATSNFVARNFWLDVNFTFPEISVSDSPLKNEVESILQSLKLQEVQVYLLRTLIEKYNLLDENFLNKTYTVIRDVSSVFAAFPSFYLGTIEDFSPNASDIPWCPDHPIKPIGLSYQNEGLLPLFSYSKARAICF